MVGILRSGIRAAGKELKRRRRTARTTVAKRRATVRRRVRKALRR